MKKEIKINDEVTSAIRKTNKKYNSYSTTIPKQIVNLLGITENDKILWKYQNQKGKLILDIDIISDENK